MTMLGAGLAAADVTAAEFRFGGAEFPVNTITAGDHNSWPGWSVARSPDGSFVIV